MKRRLQLVDDHQADRPRVRDDCRDGPRPCPWVSCRHHLYLDIVKAGGGVRVKIHYPDLDVDEIPETCSLDVADAGANGKPKTLEQCGVIFNVTRERVRQIEAKAVRKLKIPAADLRVFLGGDADPATGGRYGEAVADAGGDAPWSDRQYMTGGGESWHMRRKRG